MLVVTANLSINIIILLLEACIVCVKKNVGIDVCKVFFFKASILESSTILPGVLDSHLKRI